MGRKDSRAILATSCPTLSWFPELERRTINKRFWLQDSNCELDEVRDQDLYDRLRNPYIQEYNLEQHRITIERYSEEAVKEGRGREGAGRRRADQKTLNVKHKVV